MNRYGEAASPLYEKVKIFLLAKIGSGELKYGERLPSENELVAELGISRMTVNRALRELTATGLLVRVQGIGTFLAPPKPHAALLEINNIASEIRDRGHAHRSTILKLEKTQTPPDITLEFGFAKRRSVFHSVIIHFENDEAVQIEERFVNSDLVPDYLQQDFIQTTTYDYLMRITPISELEHVFSAIAADASISEHLGVPVNAPCLLLKRRTWTGNVVVTVNRLTYAGSRYTFGSRYKPQATPLI